MVFFSDYYDSMFIDRFPYKHKNWQLHGILITPFQNSICKKLHFQLKNVKNNHSSTSNLLDYTKFCTKKRHAPSFSKICTLHENGSNQRLRNLPENFKPEFKPVTKNFQEKLHQEECKQSKCAKICASRRELECEKFSKTFCKLFTRKNICKIKETQNIPVNLRAFLNPLKTFQKNLTLKGTPLTLPHLTF